jgi:GNAT superfamily N-acetyltransferase
VPDPLIPAHAGIQGPNSPSQECRPWTPAFAGVSGGELVAPGHAVAPPLIRIAQTDDDIVAIHRFMVAHAAAEMAEAEVDALIYMRTIHDTVREGAGLIAIVNGEIAGYLGLWKSRYDYSKAFFLHDRGFYVLPAHRGAVGAALLQEARAIAQEGGFTLKIIDTNPSRRRRAVTGQILGFRPAGRVFTEIPRQR